ncbi:MAG: hypothetical protein K5888_06850 [Lachnospiraceae bacterium]|nr:hypothetical protein [Lachnospiraceae bacterium]
MKNPLLKRLPREIKSQWKKYLVLFGMLTLTIGFVSGMFVANNSMISAIKDSYTKYNIEDGHFDLKEEPTDELIGYLEAEGIKTYRQYYKDFEEDADLDGKKDAKVRVFRLRDEVNGICLMEGEFPKNDNEIVIDRMHADNLNIRVGDTIALSGQSMIVTGLVAFSDYSTLYEKSTDIMFDALTFDIAAVTAEAYDRLRGIETYQYAFIYNDRPQNEIEQKEKGDVLVKQLAVLSATGGLLDDVDKAEELEALVDRAKDLEDEADKLEAEGDALKVDADQLQSEADELEAEGNALKEEGEKLSSKGTRLESDMQTVTAKVLESLNAAGVAVDPGMMSGTSGDIPAEVLMLLPEDLRAEIASIKRDGEKLKKDAADLEDRGRELEERGNDLKERGDELNDRKEDLEDRADILKDRGDELEGEFRALIDGIESLDDLEKYEDNTNELTDFVPEYANNAIHFAQSDLGSDKSMSEVLLIVLVVVLAFIFAITVSNTIDNEAAVIGTLRSSGYTRFELLIHYITVPVFTTIIAAVTGNVLGYTLLKNVAVNMYFNSYSLSTYVTLWTPDAFIKTTVYPVILMIAICVITVYRKLLISPLKFLRHDLSMSKRKKAVKLPNWSFLKRFRLRILFQNAPDYIVLFLGILFVMIMLVFCVGLPATLDNYKKDVRDYVLADYQYILKGNEDRDGNRITTAEPSAEEFGITGLKTVDGIHVDEDISVYGYADGSSFINLPAVSADNDVYISVAYADKFGLKENDGITLSEKYSNKQYTFNITGIYDLPGSLAVLMPLENFNRVFDLEDGSFTGYLSKNRINDIDESMIASVITTEDSLKIVNQLDHSLGAYIDYFSLIFLLMAMLLMYLLTKLIIEKNAVSISMVKVLGYSNREINGLYVYLTAVIVAISSVITALLSIKVVSLLWTVIMNRMNGWFVFDIGVTDIVKVVLGVFAAYLVVSLFDMRRIRRVPLTEALKNVE